MYTTCCNITSLQFSHTAYFSVSQDYHNKQPLLPSTALIGLVLLMNCSLWGRNLGFYTMQMNASLHKSEHTCSNQHTWRNRCSAADLKWHLTLPSKGPAGLQTSPNFATVQASSELPTTYYNISPKAESCSKRVTSFQRTQITTQHTEFFVLQAFLLPVSNSNAAPGKVGFSFRFPIPAERRLH